MKLENGLNPTIIDAPLIEEHEKILEEKLFQFELEYVDKIFSRDVHSLGTDSPHDDVSSLISKYTELDSKIAKIFRKKYKYQGNIDDFDLSARQDFQDNILEQISDFYHLDHKNWVKKTCELLELNSKEKIDKEVEKENSEKDQNSAGLLNFEIKNKFTQREKDLGIQEGDSCIEIHFDDFCKQKVEKSNTALSARDSLKVLAEKIVNEYPETKIVIAESWLMDRFGESLGFKIQDVDYNKIKLSGQFWTQFIDQNGQIKEKEISEFLKTGKPTYQVKIGVISTDDFLKKYLSIKSIEK